MFSSRAFLIGSLVLLVLVALLGLSLSAAAQPLPAAPAIDAAIRDAGVPQALPRQTILVTNTMMYLPFIVRQQVPDVPVLNPIPAGPHCTYQVTWSPSARAVQYTLEEYSSVNPQWIIVYVGAGTAWNAGGRPAGTYDYRVKASNDGGNSAYSGVQSTAVSAGIIGRVTYGGPPAGGFYLDLRYFNGSTWSTIGTTLSNPDGTYAFYPPPLAPGQLYYVRYLNGSSGNPRSPSYASTAWGRDIGSFAANSCAAGGDLDVATIVLASPPPGATVGLPATFTWQPRAGVPSDNYRWELFQITGPGFWDSNPLGYVASFILPGLPGGFGTGVQYGWAMWTQNAQGDGAASYYYRTVTFASRALVPAPDGPGSDLFNVAVTERIEAAKVAGR